MFIDIYSLSREVNRFSSRDKLINSVPSKPFTMNYFNYEIHTAHINYSQILCPHISSIVPNN